MDVDYLRYADSIRQGNQQRLSDLQAAFAQIQQNKRQAAQDAMAQQEASRRATLADLQIGALKRENDYQQGLEGAMSNPRTLTSLTQGPVQTMPSLASLGGPSFGPETPQYNGPMIPGVTQQTRTQSPAEAGAEYAMSKGRTEDAAKFISLNETMAKQAALARQYGDVEKAAQIDAATEKMTKAATLLSGWKKAGGTQFAMAQAAKLPDLFGNIDMTKMDAGEDGINKYALPNGQYAVWSDENPGQIHLTAAPPHEKDQETWGEPYQTNVGGKKVMVQKSNRGQIKAVAQDASTTVKVSTDGAPKAPSGYRWAAGGTLEPIPGGPADKPGHGGTGGKVLPASQLESIADMKRVKDVLAEAGADMESGKVATGPVAGRLQALGSKVGAASDGFVNVQQKLQTAQNIMLKLRSGAAVTESEYNRFLKEYPTPNDPPEVFKRKMQNTLNYANTLMDDKMSIFEEGGYRVPQSVKNGGRPAPAKATSQKPAPGKGKVQKIGKYTVEVH